LSRQISIKSEKIEESKKMKENIIEKPGEKIIIKEKVESGSVRYFSVTI
jgi:hypothetical protein